MVSEDSAGRLFVVESRVETGASVKPLAEYLVNIEERSVLFRHRDPALARRAGRAIHDIVAGAIAAGRPIAYDLSLDLDDHKRVFCAELVHMAFEAASNGAVQIPRHASRIKRFARSTFMRDFGVSITKTFLPSDMELDPRFDVVAEHRNIPLLRDIRLRNAAVASLYRWLDAGYSFRPEAMSEAVGPTLARLQFGAAPVADVPRARLALFVKLRTAIKMLEDDLRSRDRRWRAERGRAMAFRELLSELEAMRREDCARFLARRAIPDEASVFHLHDLLNVANGDCRAVR
jgi:hypothetical protein